jgi:hypothetical protein
MINALQHIATGAIVQFPGNPLRESSETNALQQVSGFDSDGIFYLYHRNNAWRREIRLIYTQVSTAVRDTLLTFVQSRNGDKYSFTWHDHDNISHTARFTSGSITHKETGPGHHRCELSLTIDTPATTISGIETDWADAFSRPAGLTPIWILRTNFDGTVRDISDSVWTFPVSSLNGFNTTLPLVAQWGQIHENISGNIGEILVSDFNLTLLADQDDANNIRHMALQHELEKNPVELYLTAAELNPTIVPPRLMFRGNIKDISIPDETQVQITIEDETTRLSKNLGTKISSEVYQLCDPDEVGKMIPIVFGTVSKGAARCVDSGWVTSIVDDIDSVTTSIKVSELPATSVQNKSITIDDEQLLIQSVDGKTLTVIRGQNSTAAVVHTSGSTLMEKKATPLIYLLADHELTSIGTIYARVRGIDVDITSDCAKVLGTTGDQLAAYPGKAAITIPDFAKVSQRVQLAVDDQIRITDALHNHATGATEVPTHTSNPITTLPVTGKAYPGPQPPYSDAGFWTMCYAVFPDDGTVLSSVINISCSSNCADWKIFLASGPSLDTGAVEVFASFYKYSSLNNFKITPKSASDMQLRYVHIAAHVDNTYGSPTTFPMGLGPAGISVLSRQITTVGGGVATSLATGNVGKSGTVTLSGNSVADIMLGDMILVDKVRNLSTPLEVCNDILTTYCNDTTLAQTGTLPDFYRLNGEITEYKPAIEWLDYLAFQSKCWFRKTRGVSRLIVRHADPVAPTIIPACCLTSEGLRGITYKKAPLNDVINIINLLYDRDWSFTGKNAEAYQKSMPTSDAASVAIYGPLEQPNMFMLDFVANVSHATDLNTFFHDFYAVRKWLVGFETYLNWAEMEFSDEVQLSFAQDLTGIIIEAGLQPGDSGKIDNIRFTAAVTHLPVENELARLTELGDYRITMDGEVLEYSP